MNDLETLGVNIKLLILLIVSTLGASLGYISRQWGVDKTIRISRLIFSVFAAIFMTVLLKTACDVLELNYQWTLIIIGLFSWLGTDVTVTLLERIVYRKLGLSHVYIKNEANCTRNIKPGGVYTLDELQSSKPEVK